MTDRWVVKSRRFIDGVEITSVRSHPLSRTGALEHLADLNDNFQTPGNYYIEKWKEQSNDQ